MPPARTLDEQFWPKVYMTSGCWLWLGATNGQGPGSGHGKLRVKGRQFHAHRVSYEQVVGAIPEGLELDHLCRNPACVRPDHLEPVTHAENMRRAAAVRTHCAQGHPWDEENTYRNVKGSRQCRACSREHMRRRRAQG